MLVGYQLSGNGGVKAWASSTIGGVLTNMIQRRKYNTEGPIVGQARDPGSEWYIRGGSAPGCKVRQRLG